MHMHSLLDIDARISWEFPCTTVQENCGGAMQCSLLEAGTQMTWWNQSPHTHTQRILMKLKSVRACTQYDFNSCTAWMGISNGVQAILLYGHIAMGDFRKVKKKVLQSEHVKKETLSHGIHHKAIRQVVFQIHKTNMTYILWVRPVVSHQTCWHTHTLQKPAKLSGFRNVKVSLWKMVIFSFFALKFFCITYSLSFEDEKYPKHPCDEYME